MNSNYLKESFDVVSKYEAFYTGGNIEWSENGEQLFCQNKDFISIVTISNGTVIKLGKVNKKINDEINSFSISKDGKFIITHHKSSLFKLWSGQELKLIKIWKSIHNGPVSAIALTKDGLSMASGGIDGSVRLWDLKYHVCIHNLKGTVGVVNIVYYHPNLKKEIVFATADDYAIHGWNIKTGLKEMTLEGHFSKVTSLTVHEDGVHALSSGRDKVLILWDLIKKISLRILPVFECIEGAFIIPNTANLPIPKIKTKSSIYAASAGENGIVKIWEMKSGRMLFHQTNSLIPAAKEENSLAVKHLLYNAKDNNIGLVSTNHNILIYTLNKFECKKQLIGFIDEILDIVYLGSGESHLAVATNTSDIKLYELTTMNCQILCGHTNIILSLGSSQANRNLLISSDKDKCVRLWLMDEKTKIVNCIALGIKHTAAVGCVALSQIEIKFFVSVSQDFCLKLWDLPENLSYTGTEVSLNAINTVMAHQKDINSVVVSPNDKLIATGSQDKTAKLWSAENLQQLGVFRGHRRGVSCVRFSPIDQVLATSSADCTIKLWSLNELNCLKTFEGNESTVLKMEFLSRGMQIISSGGDGLLKLWNIKSSECITTLDQHNSRVWSLTVNKDETHFVSGGSDSLLVVWRDVTQEKKAKALALKDELARDEQKLENCLEAKKLKKALRLALKLQKPMHVLHIIEALIRKGDENMTIIICGLKPLYQEELLKCAMIWNTNARNFQLAQLVINVILNEIGLENLQRNDLKGKLESIIPYTNRHFKRLTQLYQDLHFLLYTINNMKSCNTAQKTIEI
ncbi:PREDICTED: transducin beta-like protein 3 [Ceratosolen solmsi marchali]|uniref:Transducin beta-like protein 3 n=1 Tax=Ceratosolen solmsi marchali TaxID=326594 RepID=A0AAJ7E116_9HYME|nr:PREDICTED: transducin beta-like protein 3 [Ceratosolen solmsi marchali]